MIDWLFTFAWLLGLVAGYAGCLLFARFSWRRSRNGANENWLALAVLALLWSGFLLPPIFEIGNWLVNHAWLLS